jgi:hypothetical protein
MTTRLPVPARAETRSVTSPASAATGSSTTPVPVLEIVPVPAIAFLVGRDLDAPAFAERIAGFFGP